MASRTIRALTVLAIGVAIGVGAHAFLSDSVQVAQAQATKPGPDLRTLAAEVKSIQGKLPSQSHTMQDVSYHFGNSVVRRRAGKLGPGRVLLGRDALAPALGGASDSSTQGLEGQRRRPAADTRWLRKRPAPPVARRHRRQGQAGVRARVSHVARNLLWLPQGRRQTLLATADSGASRIADHQLRSPRHLAARLIHVHQANSSRRLGPRHGEPVHGSLVGDDPFAAAGVLGVGARRGCGNTGPDRGRGRGDRVDRQGVFRRLERSPGPPQAAGGVRLRFGGARQATVPAGKFCQRGVGRPLCRPAGQRRPRRTA